ncbi:hypothetical protein RIF29_25193 [Crotalaria pallida]|uniref:Uncharacterized protein n=1 Tax=Crotalaria pallida TaxID=3830 RepID=A0AAN9HZK3_CROPI
MARKKRKPPKSPTFHTSSPAPSNAIPKNLELEHLDEDDFDDIDALSPKKAASILQKLDALRAKIKGKAVADDEGHTNEDLEPDEHRQAHFHFLDASSQELENKG